MCKLCVFAGTAEGRRLIERLRGRGAHITACVATGYSEALIEPTDDVRVRIGRLDAGEMEALLREEGFDAVVDATHPYADKATENIAAACECAGVPYMRLQRESSADAADGVFVPDAAACAEYLMTTRGDILLTTGSKDLPAYCADRKLRRRLWVRVLPMSESLAQCAACGIAPARVMAMQGPFDEAMNLAMLRFTGARTLVTKDTGGAGGYAAKIGAARRAGAGVVVIGRPPQREGRTLDEIAGALEARYALTPVPRHVTLVGIGMGNAETRTLGMERALKEADCLIGARRMLDSVDCAGKRTHAAYAPVEIARILSEDRHSRRIAVLLSGDTGFFSGAKGLLAELQGVETEVLPGISSLQYFCAKLGRPWEDVRAISLHGRDADLARKVREHPSVFALVGGEDGVNSALARLEAAGLGHAAVAVGERLGYPEERITCGTAAGLVGGKYHALSVLLVDNPEAGRDIATCGLPDEWFDRDETPMTKSEARAVTLSKLQLTRDSVVYDIGSGSGSVTVEAARMVSRGAVYAVEMKPEAAALTRRNLEKFHLTNATVVEGRAPEALSALPAPTHAFIGGAGGSLREIVACLLEKNPRVRVVANAVTLESLSALTGLSAEFDHADIAEISVSKPRALGRYRLMTAHNPVAVFAMWNEAGKEGDPRE